MFAIEKLIIKFKQLQMEIEQNQGSLNIISLNTFNCLLNDIEKLIGEVRHQLKKDS